VPISIQCPGCGGRFRAPDELAGKIVKCPKCSIVIRVGGVSRRQTGLVEFIVGRESGRAQMPHPRPSSTPAASTASQPAKVVAGPACGDSVAVPEVVLAEIVETDQHKSVCERCKKEVANSELEPTLGFNICKACGIAIQQGTATPMSGGTTSRSGGCVGPARSVGSPFASDKDDSCSVQVTILFAGAFFVGDCLLDVILDGVSVGRGSLIKGFMLSGRATPGRHELRVKWGRKTCLQGVVSFDQPGRYSIRLSLNRWLKQFAIADIFRDKGENGFSPEGNQSVPINHGLPVETHFTSMPMPERARAAARVKPAAIPCVSIADVEQKYRWLFIPVLSWLGLVFPLVLPPIPLGPIEFSIAWNRRGWMSHITRSLSALGKKRKTYVFPLGWCVNVFINLVDMATLGLSHLFVTASLHDQLAKKAGTNDPHGDFSAVAWVSKWLLLGNVVFVMVYIVCPGLLFRRILLSMEGHLRTLESEAAKEEPIIAQFASEAAPSSLSEIAPVSTALGRVTLTIEYAGQFFLVDSKVRVVLDGAHVGEGSAVTGIKLRVGTEPGMHTLDVDSVLRKKQYTLDLRRPGFYTAHLQYSRMWGNFTKNVDLRFLGASGQESQVATRAGVFCTPTVARIADEQGGRSGAATIKASQCSLPMQESPGGRPAPVPVVPEVVSAVSGNQGIEGKADPRGHGGCSAGVVNLIITFPGKRLMANMRLPMLLDGVEIGTLRARSGCNVQVRTGLGAHCLQLKTWLDKHTLTLQFSRPGNYVALLAYSRWSGKFTVESLNCKGAESVAELPVSSDPQGNGTRRRAVRKKRWLIAAGVLLACFVLMAWLGSMESPTWSAAQRANTPIAYQDYLRRFPNGEHVSAARERIEQLQQESERLQRETAALWDLFPEWAQWGKVVREDSNDGYEAFLRKFPQGRYAEAVRRRIQEKQSNPRLRSCVLDVITADLGSLFNPDIGKLKTLPRALEADPPVRGHLCVVGSLPRSGGSWPDELRREPDFVEATVLVVEARTVKIGEYNVSGKAGYREEAQLWMIRWPARQVVAVTTLSADPVKSRTVAPMFSSVTSKEEYGDVGPALKEWIGKRPHVKLCYICGDVKSPGQYELKEGSIFDLLKMAGGTASGTTAPRMRVCRTNMKLLGGSEMDMREYDPSDWDPIRRRYIQTVNDADIVVVGNPEKTR